MTKKELRKISLQYRTLSSQVLKINDQNEISYIQMYYNFITDTPFIAEYIHRCNNKRYDFNRIFKEKRWNEILTLPASQEDLVDYGYQLLSFILEGPKQLFILGHGYTTSNKISDSIEAFVRKSVEPFLVAIQNFLELELIECDDQIETTNVKRKTVFLSYCQKDSDIADLIDMKLGTRLQGKATISRDIRDVVYHESFKRFMQSIEQHDYVITIVSDNYLKSRNCMYEMLEVVKDSNFSNKLIIIVLCDEDLQYYKTQENTKIGANIYSTEGQTVYTSYWRQQENNLQNQIDEIGEATYAVTQIKEKQHVIRILLDLPQFIEFIRDNKGLSLSKHIEHDFSDIIEFMNI